MILSALLCTCRTQMVSMNMKENTPPPRVPQNGAVRHQKSHMWCTKENNLKIRAVQEHLHADGPIAECFWNTSTPCIQLKPSIAVLYTVHMYQPRSLCVEIVLVHKVQRSKFIIHGNGRNSGYTEHCAVLYAHPHTCARNSTVIYSKNMSLHTY